jgi:hypothetical protein
MADVETPAAESSPAAPAATPEPTPAEPVSVPKDPEAYAEWRQTGKLPEQDDKPKKEPSARSKSVDEESEKGAPVSETGKQKGRENAETRIKQLLAERDTYKSKLEALEAGKKDAPAASSTAPAKDAKAESSTAPDLQRPVRPKQEDFNDWGSYEAAQDKYLEDLADFKAAKRLEEHTLRQRQESATADMQKRLDDAKSRYGDEAETKITATAKTIFEDAKVAPALKAAIGRSDVIVDALYVMGSDEAEMSEFVDLAIKDPLEALRKWFTVEALVKEELAKSPAKESPNGAPARGPDGKFLPERVEKPAKREAPSPPRELGGNSSPPGDERERAAKTGDFRSFKADADRRDLQRFRGQ